jgi:hypothetical protein
MHDNRQMWGAENPAAPPAGTNASHPHIFAQDVAAKVTTRLIMLPYLGLASFQRPYAAGVVTCTEAPSIFA